MTNHLEATFGVEIECYLPEGATQAQAAAAVSQRIGEPVNVETYNHYARPAWKVVTDGSLGDYQRGCEFVSPVLRGEAGLAQVEAVGRALTDFGCSVSKRCGLHVHVGVGSPDLGFFKNLLKLYSVFEPVIDSIMPVSRRASTNMFCRSMTAASPAAIDRAADLEALIRVAGGRGHESRYFKLNLTAFRRHRTVEFRQHSGTLDATKVRMWTLTCLRMVAAAKRGALPTSNGPASVNRARPGTKAHQIGQMFLRPEGVTGREVMTAMGWPSVSMPAQARSCGIEFTTQRTGRETRYFARAAAAVAAAAPITVAGFAETIGSDAAERAYMESRRNDLSGAVAWAA